MPSLYDKMLKKSVQESEQAPRQTITQVPQTSPSTNQTEKEMPASHIASNTARRQDDKPPFQQAILPAIQQDSKPTEKVTYRFHPQGVKAIKEMKWILFNDYEIEADLAEIAEAAILIAHNDLLACQQYSNIVLQLNGKPASRKTG